MYLADYLNRKLTLAYEIVGQRSNARFAGKATVASAQEVARLKLFESLAHLPPGDYDLTLSLKQQGRVIARRKTGFSLKWSLASLIKNDFEHAVEQLKYIISKRERRELLEVSDSMRLEKFEEWWASKDPTEGTPENELRDEYYRRIRYANQYYRSINREGWQTDRGMIYIKYGEPDQIDRHPFELGRKPFQIWYYYAQRRTFVFEDNHGDGDYQLQYPYDGDWRRYIGP
ncbi:MAG: GWxTD domain-containing protein [candidate division Zixibacteria bacterium]|nr:GWxTD domain-containing protein [candidate division Zixibacteria bacterium]